MQILCFSAKKVVFLSEIQVFVDCLFSSITLRLREDCSHIKHKEGKTMAGKTKSVAIQLLEARVQELETELEDSNSELESANDRLTKIYALTSEFDEDDLDESDEEDFDDEDLDDEDLDDEDTEK